jgi:hypothetical protein
LQAKSDADAHRTGENRQRSEMNARVLQNKKMPITSTMLLTTWAMAYCRERSSPLCASRRLKRKRFVPEENQKTATNSAISRKIWTRLRLIAGSGAVQASGIPAAFTAVTVKNTTAVKLRIVVTIAMKFVSILNRLKKRRTIWLCKNRAMISPAAKNPTKAISPRTVM